MSTVPFRRLGTASQRPLEDAVDEHAQQAPTALAVALLLVLLYAVFSHGAVALATEARVQVAIDAIVVVAGAAWLWTGSLSVRASRIAFTGLGLLAGFAAWSGISVLWSVAPNQTWIELNRDITYVLVLGLGIALGSSGRRTPDLLASGFLLVALAVTCYALGQKLLPGLHIHGVFDLNQTGPLPRLQEPLGYWNALALFVAFGVPIALARAADRVQSPRIRIGALISAQLMLLTIGLTYSRGGLIALAVGLAVGIALSGDRLRMIMWLAAAAVAAVPALTLGLTAHALNSANVGLTSREHAGAVLFLVVIVSCAALALGARRLQDLEARVYVGPERASRIGRLLLGAAAAMVIVALLLVTVSSRGLTGTVSHAWHSFTATRVTSNYDPARLLSASSENRWVWWKEAAGAFSDRPVAGWGAGSFPVVHLLYRRDGLAVNQPHSVPLQFLAETGLIGTLLAGAGLGLLLLAALRRVRRQTSESERLVVSALLAASVMYLVHCLYDWDWDIPAVTLPALLFLGVLVASPDPVARALPPTLGRGARAVALTALTVCACVFALSAATPSLAASKASRALVEASGSASEVQDAQSTARLASRLDPLSDAGLLVESTIAVRRGEFQQARSLLVSAVGRNPSDPTAWQQLAFIELRLGDRRDSVRAGERAAALDPLGSLGADLVGAVQGPSALTITPPRDSATAQPLR